MALRSVTTEDASSGFGRVWSRLMVSKGRTLARVTGFLFVRRGSIGLMLKRGLDKREDLVSSISKLQVVPDAY